MEMRTDDEVYSVDNVFLGPPRVTLPWRARYQAYGVFALLAVLILAALNLLGLLAFWPIAYGLLAAVGLTRKITPHITHDTSVRSVITTLFHEVRAPRSPATVRPVVTEMSLRDVHRRPTCP
ncbi:hypothetical protein [Streptomyces sp. NPDC017940]|uniref:hypothetical protein n=1 Tax=Streptomyces sp. NPDC017940 TaxID=3365017 RepID=UPI0037AD2A15